MNSENNFFTIAENYLSHQLSPADLKKLEERLITDTTFQKEFWEAVSLSKTIQQAGATNKFKQTLKAVAQDKNEVKKKNFIHRIWENQIWQTTAIAASVTVLLSLGMNFWQMNKQRSNASKYSELKKVHSEIAGIKASQNKIIKDLNTKVNQPLIENTYSGTGFALTNDGYLITNYHVTKDADSLYVQTKDGNFYKAYIVSFDANNDLAILKIEQKKFKFSKQNNIPYTFSNSKSTLGASIYTLGYPQDDIVYNEGYISSKNGYMGNPLQYSLEIPSEPGSSGAPVFDNNGNVIAMITGRESNTRGKTYAVTSEAMINLLKNIPQSEHVNLPKVNRISKLSRTQQLEKIEEFTCEINVYK
jgi:serine protease Do